MKAMVWKNYTEPSLLQIGFQLKFDNLKFNKDSISHTCESILG